jgi:urease accessory protein
VLTALLLAAQPAHAHPVIEGVGGFYGGLLHPLMVPAHLMTLVVLGLLAGQQAAVHRRALMGLLAASLIVGLLAVVAAVSPIYQDLVVLAASVFAGVLVAIAQPVSVAISLPLVVVAGVAIELDSVPQEISMLTTFLALIGTVVAGATIAAVMAEFVPALRRDWQRIGVRVVGAWIAAGAILVLALRLVR